MAGFYAKGIEVGLEAATGSAAAPTGTLTFVFMDTSYTFDAEAHEFYSDISADIAENTTKLTVSGLNIIRDTADNEIQIDLDNPTIATVTTSTDKGVLFMDTGVDSTSPLIVCSTITPEVNPVSGTLTGTLPADGIGGISY